MVQLMQRGICLIVFLILYSTSVRSAMGDVLRTVTLSGMHAPGTSVGTQFKSFGPAALNNAGHTIFDARLVVGSGDATVSSDGGVWSEGSGSLALIAREGSPVPNANAGAVFDIFDRILLNDAGQAAIKGTARGGLGGASGDNGISFWTEGAGSLGLLVRHDMQAPDAPAGALFDLFVTIMLINNSGESAFMGTLKQGSGGVTNANDEGIWFGVPGSLSVIARQGSQAPDTPAGATFSRFNPIVLSNQGSVAFQAQLTSGGGGVIYGNDYGIWSGGHGSLSLVARQGSPAPDGPAGATFFAFGERVAINSAGQTAFRGHIEGVPELNSSNDGGIWSEGSGTLALVTREGDHAPGTAPGTVFSHFNAVSPLLNDAGQTAFIGFLVIGTGDATSANVEGVWSEGSGTLNLVARSGSQAPGTNIDVNFATFDSPVLNSEGQMAFIANLVQGSGGVNSLNYRGIWAQDASGVLRLIVRTGDQLDVDDGPGVDLRTVSNFNFHGTTGNGDGYSSGFNDLGQVAFWAKFTDGTEGIFVSNLAAVPEPGSLVLFCLGLLLLRVGMRRHRIRESHHFRSPARNSV